MRKINKAVICSKHSYSTIKGIVSQLDNVDLFRSVNNKMKPTPDKQYDMLIRWGGIASLPLSEESIIYNKSKGISNASNKLKARRIMEENGVNIPKTWSANEAQEIEFPVIGRPKRHFGGRNFHYCSDIVEVMMAHMEGCDYFSQYYPKQKEYRVHVAHGKALIVAEKIVSGDSDKPWNLSRRGICEEFNTLRWSKYPTDIVELGVKSVKALGLDYGAVDIMAEPKDSNLPSAVVLEVNTAPLLGNYGQERYAEYFKWLFAHNRKVDLFEGDTQRDYWFTHSQLEVA